MRSEQSMQIQRGRYKAAIQIQVRELQAIQLDVAINTCIYPQKKSVSCLLLRPVLHFLAGYLYAPHIQYMF